MTVAPVHCSIEAKQGGMVPYRARVKVYKLGGVSHLVLIMMFMVPLG